MQRLVFEIIGSLALLGIGMFFGTLLVSTVAAKRIKEQEIEATKIRCFHCLRGQVCWDADLTLNEGGCESVVNLCHCNKCGAEIKYIVRKDQGDE